MLSSFFRSSQNNEDDTLVDVESSPLGGDSSTEQSSSLLPDSVRSWWTNEEENESLFPSLTYSQRLQGFFVCFGVGMLLSFLSSFSLMSGNLKGFAFVYTTGNVVALAGTTFLVGPRRQMKSMFERHRALASAIYLGTLCLSIIVALQGWNVLIVLILLCIQWCAGIWYTASYIPFARNAIVSCCKSVLSL